MEASSRSRVVLTGCFIAEAQQNGVKEFSEVSTPMESKGAGTRGKKRRGARSAVSSRRERFSMVLRMPMKP